MGRFRTLEEADQLIRQGECDLVAMNRANIADPDLVNKTLAGKPEEVRPCIACNQGCIGRELGPGGIGCAVNPGAGRELAHLLSDSAAHERAAELGAKIAAEDGLKCACDASETAICGRNLFTRFAAPSSGQ